MGCRVKGRKDIFQFELDNSDLDVEVRRCGFGTSCVVMGQRDGVTAEPV